MFPSMHRKGGKQTLQKNMQNKHINRRNQTKNIHKTKQKTWITFALLFMTFLVLCVSGCTTEKDIKQDISSLSDIHESAPPGSVSIQERLGVTEGYQQGSYVGRLTCTDADIDVGLYRTGRQMSGKTAQTIVDREDSAACIPYGDGLILADHDYQGFSNLSKVSSGSLANITGSDGLSVPLVCTEVTRGTKIDNIILEDGVVLEDIIDGRLAMYTCTDNPVYVLVTLWEILPENGMDNIETSNQQF